MKKIMLILAIGSVFGYYIRKMQNDGEFDCVCDGTLRLLKKSKKNLKNIADIATNEAEYLKDRVEDKFMK